MFRVVKDQVLSFFFPPLCLHCQERISNPEKLFCEGCLPLFELLSVHERCKGCFCETGKRGICPDCRQRKQWKLELAAAIPYQGPAASLVKKLKKGSAPYLAKTAAAWMAVQFEALGWPSPDAIVPIPSGFLKRVWNGKDHAHHIADELSMYLNVPVIQPLLKKSSVRPQGKLNKAQRQKLSFSSFYLKKRPCISDKTLLLIDDVMTTGTTLRMAADKLREGFPKKVYALTLCYTGID